MDIDHIYRELTALYSNGALTLSYHCVEKIFDGLLMLLLAENLKITGEQPQKKEGEVSFSGYTNPACFCAGGTLSVSIRVENARAVGEVSFSFEGEYALADFFAGNTLLAESPFKNFKLRSPVFCASLENVGNGMVISGNTKPDFSGQEWDDYRDYFDGRLMPTEGFYFCGSLDGSSLNMDFTIHFSGSTDSAALSVSDVALGNVSFPVLSAVLAMRTVKERFSNEEELRYLLILNLQKSELFEQGISLQIPILVEGNYIEAAAYFSPVLSAGNVLNFLVRLTGADVSRLLPKETFLTAFGLKFIGIQVENDLAKISDAKQMEVVFDLERPWQTPFPNLALDQFQVSFIVSWWNQKRKDVLVTSDFLVRASLRLKSHTITGMLKGYLPDLEFEGTLALYEDDAMSLGGLSEDLGAKLPDKWTGKNPIAMILVSTSLKNKILYLSAQAENVLSIDIGSTVFRLEAISAYITVTPEKTSFGIEGGASFGSGEAEFLMTLYADYQDGWSFGGRLGRGKVNIGKLLKQMFGIQGGTSEEILSITLTEFEFSYSVDSGQFFLYAVMEAGWKLPMGLELEAGGRLKLSQEKEKSLAVSAAVYAGIGDFLCLVQADNLSGKEPSYLFRVQFGKGYAQAVYEKNKNNENVLILSLGGITLGEIVEAFIRLINPNAKTHLESPWDVLNRINLSAFSLEINVDKKTAVFWVDINKCLAGLIELGRIGLTYKDGHVRYQLTGKMLGQEYSEDDPVSWDAQTGMPPTPSAQETKIYYIGLGQHIGVDVSAETIAKVLKSIAEKLKPGQPSLSYSDSVGFLFAADFAIADMFRLKAVFVDPKLYGIQIVVSASEKSPAAVLNGLELELLYRKISESVGMFACTLTVPKKFSTVQLGAVTVHIGRIYVEIYTNGSFLIDLGFPHDEDFSQSFGIEFGIFTGRGGIYFGILKGDAVKSVPDTDKGTFTPVVLIGLGVSIGLGRSFDAGIVKGAVSLTLLAMLEGVFAVYRPKLIEGEKEQDEEFYYCLSAKAGICGTLFLSVDFKIITICASARVEAVCALALESYRDTQVSLSLALEVSASIKILFIRIRFSFSFHRMVSFKLAEGRTAPWDAISDSGTGGRLECPARFEPRALGKWTIKVDIVPVVSMYDPLEKTKRYCIAFLATVDENSFAGLADLFLQWIMYEDTESDDGTRDYVFALQDSLLENITWNTLEDLFRENLTAYVSLALAGGENDKERDAVSFPMLPGLILKANDETVDFGQNLVDGAYYQKISDYLALLNADPCMEKAERAENTEESLPVCAAVAVDYFRMLISGIMDKLKELYEEISVSEISIAKMLEDYQPDADAFLLANPDLVIEEAAVKGHVHVLSGEDTLEKLEELDADPIWGDISEQSSILCLGFKLTIDFTYDNQTKLSPRVAAAAFYSRYSSRDIVYLKHVEQLRACGLTSAWECEEPGEVELPLGSGETYQSLPGDTLVRVARMLSVLEEDYEDQEWEAFYRRFLAVNNLAEDDMDPRDSYQVNCETVITDDPTLLKLFRRVYPDFRGNPEKRGLWKTALFEPLQEIRFGRVNAEPGKTLGELTELYGTQELAAALASGGLKAKEKQTMRIPAPKKIPSDVVTERIGKASQEIGAMLSRFFLQGLRVPSRSDDGTLPLYGLLKQQIPLDGTQELSVALGSSPASGWIAVDTEVKTLSPEQIGEMLPSGELPKRALPQALPECEKQESYASLFDFRIMDGALTVAALPECLRKDLQKVSSDDKLQLFADGRETGGIQWGVVMDVAVQRAGKDAYVMFGVSAGDRKRLLSMIKQQPDSLSVAFTPSKLSSGTSQLVSTPKDSCVLVKTNLSVQTHMGFYGLPAADGENSDTYSAKLAQTKQFLTLLWQCSVIGGGFFLHCEKIPENIFAEDGRATLCICAVYSDFASAKEVADSILISGKCREIYLKNNEKTVYAPASPVGSARLATKLEENGTVEELFQIMSYTAQVGKKSVESAPVFPQGNADGNFYLFTVPLYRLVDQENCYSAVGKTLSLEVGLRDILGNYAKLGDVDIKGSYNDELLSICEYPRTRVSYQFVDDKKTPKLLVCLEYLPLQGQEKGTEQEQSRAKTAMRQLDCTDVYALITCTAQTDTEWKLAGTGSGGSLLALRTYMEQLCAALSEGGGAVQDVEISFPLDMDKLPGDIFALGVTFGLVRDGCESKCEKVCRAVAAIPASESMQDCAGFGEVLLASCGTGLYGVRKSFLSKLNVSAYEYEGKKTPRFYAMAPFSNQLVTRRIVFKTSDGQEEARTYYGCDLNAWVKRFLEDVELLLGGEYACMAGAVCPEQLDSLVEGKRLLAKKAAARVVPLSRELMGTDEENKNAAAMFEDYYLASLKNVYALDVAAAYQVDFPVGSTYRLETGLKESSLFLPQKIAGSGQQDSDGSNQFFLLSCNAKHRSTKQPLHFFVQDIEYHVETGTGQYDSSDWVRMRQAYTPEDSKLEADFGIPHPAALCPAAPSILGQEAAAGAIARWNYTLRLSCFAYEQETLYVRIAIGEKSDSLGEEESGDMFEVLAGYHEKRDSIFQSLKENDLSNAYQWMAETAQALANAPAGKQYAGNEVLKEVKLKLAFQKGETLSVQAEEIGSVLKDMGAKLGAVTLLSGEGIGEKAEISVSIEGLPLDVCQTVKPYAWIVQNDNLFEGGLLHVRDEFIFRTEETAGQPLAVSVIYPGAFRQKSEDLPSAVHKIWQSLFQDKADVKMQADMEISYLYQMDDVMDGLILSCPVAFIPQVPDETAIQRSVNTWFAGKSYRLSDGRLCFRVWLREKEKGRVLAQLVIDVEF